MTLFQFVTLVLGLIAAAGWLNARTLKLPPSAAMLFTGLLGAGLLVGVDRLGAPWVRDVRHALGQVNFPQTVVGYLLAFLLFAGAMQVDLTELRRRRVAVLTLATLGVLGSTVVVGFGIHYASRWAGFPLSLAWSMVFGALISPTDPVAVLSAVKTGDLSKRLVAVLQGEALFNDGVGIVVFTAALALATGGQTTAPGVVALDVLAQAGGGVVLGLASGWLAMLAMRQVDDYAVELSLTLALAAGVYSAGQALHVSGAIAVVAAGLIMGEDGVRTAMSHEARLYVVGFWNLVDEILNAVLFLLLGLQVLSIPFAPATLGLAAIAIALTLVVRLAIVAPWGFYFQERGANMILSWGGLRGALSLALALVVPQGPARGTILMLTYGVVIFSIGVQGLSFAPLNRWLARLPVHGRPQGTPRPEPSTGG